jgi:biotin carboxylase
MSISFPNSLNQAKISEKELAGKSLLLVEHGGYRKAFFFEAIRDMGINLHLATMSPEHWLNDYLPENQIIETDTHNSVTLLNDVVAYLASCDYAIDAVGTLWEHTVTQTADLAAALGKIGPPPWACRRSSCNKILMRHFASSSGVPMPRWEVLGKLDELPDRLSSFPLPAVVKPVFGDDSFGVLKIDQKSNLKEVITLCRRTWSDKQVAFRNFTDIWLLEEYVAGKVVSADGIIQGGKIHFAGVIEIEMGPEPWFIQCANYLPPRITVTEEAACREVTKATINALGFDNTAFHCELRLTCDGPVVIEIASRLPGGVIIPAYKRAYGIDFISAMVDLWFGLDVNLVHKRKDHVIQKGIFPNHPGKLLSLDLKQARKIKGIWELAAVSCPGKDVVTYPDTPVPLYFYAVAAKDGPTVSALADSIEKKVVVEMKDSLT